MLAKIDENVREKVYEKVVQMQSIYNLLKDVAEIPHAKFENK